MVANARNATYRPLLSGTRIVNVVTDRPGTLGCIGTDANGVYWIVSCYHVLGRVRGSGQIPAEGEEIWQSTADRGGSVVARTRLSKMNEAMDMGAAVVLSGIDVSTRVLELQTLLGVGEAKEGMRVLKSGAETGVTEGIVIEVSDNLVKIETSPTMPDGYVLCDHGDSGAVWIEADTSFGIAIHFTGRDSNTALARPLGMVLSALGLTLLQGT